MWKRLRRWLREILIAVDQLLHVLLAGPYYILFGGDPPSADETISSKVGRKAEEGYGWAKICRFFIDSLFSLLGEKNHCQKSVEWEKFKIAP